MTTSRAGYAAGGVRSAPQTSAMSTIPIQPVPSATGNCRKPPFTMVRAASRILAAAGRAVSRSWFRVLFTSMPSATAQAISASVITPIGGLPGWAPSTGKAADPACFIRYAAAATWSYSPTVAGEGRVMSATVAGGRAGCGDGPWAEPCGVLGFSGGPPVEPVFAGRRSARPSSVFCLSVDMTFALSFSGIADRVIGGGPYMAEVRPGRPRRSAASWQGRPVGDSRGGPPAGPVRIACGRDGQQLRRPPRRVSGKHPRASPGRPARRASWPDFTHPASGAGEAPIMHSWFLRPVDGLGSGVATAGSRRSKIIDGAWISARAWQLFGLPGDQVELVALRVGERGLADRGHAGWQRRRRDLDLVEWLGAQAGQPRGLLVVVAGDQDRMDAVFGRPGPGGMVENQPGAGLGAGGVDRRVPGDRARADRAAEGLAPEVRQGGGIGGVDGQGCETQVDGGGHDGFPSVELIHRRPRSMYGTSGSGASPRTGPTCPGGQVLVVSAGQGHLSTAPTASAVMARSSSREPSQTTVNLVILPSWLSSSAAAPTTTG